MTAAPLNSSPSILLVDDDSDQLTLLSRLLQKAGFSVQTAGDALTGFELAKETHPDLVIRDVMMPNIDGLRLCHMIRDHESLSTPPPILLLSAAQKDTEAIVEGWHQEAISGSTANRERARPSRSISLGLTKTRKITVPRKRAVSG